MKTRVAVIIINWNGKHLLEQCLRAVQAQTHTDYDIYVLDNGSTDGSQEYLRAYSPALKHIEYADHNTGFATGNNIIITKALQDPTIAYIVTLNNDTIVDPHWLEELVRVAKKDARIGMVSSKACFPSGPIQTIGLATEKNIMSSLPGGLSIGWEVAPEKFDEPMEIYCPSGVSALFTREALERVGLFDDDFFTYAEDFDLGTRIRLAGFTAWYTPHSKLIHLHSQTTGASSPFKAFYTKRNRYFVAIKCFSFTDALLFPLRDIAWDINQFLHKKPGTSVHTLNSRIGTLGLIRIALRVYWDVIRYTPRMLKKRFVINTQRTISMKEYKEYFVRFNRKEMEKYA